MNVYIWEEIPPLNFTANTAGSTVQLTQTGSPTSVSLETSTDKVNWSSYTIGDTITLSNIGDKVYIRNISETDTGFSIDYGRCYKFVMSGSIAGSGDTTSLLNKNGTTIVPTNGFYQLFYQCTSLTAAPLLPATTVGASCCYAMFYGCTSLTTSPTTLPATTLANNCYQSMFYGCTALTTVPSLPATTLAQSCYYSMFSSCSNLTTLPKLPATTLANNCYQSMFQNCSKIKLSTTKTGEYQTEYRIPITGTGTAGSSSLSYMFNNTGGTLTGTPTINTTYYTSNTVV